MKTTVKRFILDNMTDANYAKLVDMLIVESVNIYDFEIANQLTRYMNRQRFEDRKRDALKKLQSIDQTFKFDDDLPFIRDEKLVFDTPMMKDLGGESVVAINDDAEIDMEPKTKIEPHEVNDSNYKEFVTQERIGIDFQFSKFIYEIMNHHSDKKMNNSFEQFLHENSHVKIDYVKENDYSYCVYFLLDNRTRYISTEVHSAYLNLTDTPISVSQPGFIEYDELQEDLSMYLNNHMLAPFTSYLNEEITVPEESEEVIYELLKMLVHILTHQGFTENEQIETINYFDEHYDSKIV